MAATQTLLNALALRTALVRALASDTGEHAEEITEELAQVEMEITLCIQAE